MSFNSNPARVEYVINDITVDDYTFNFQIFNPTELNVYLSSPVSLPDDENNLLEYQKDYTVIINNDTGGFITLLNTPGLQSNLVIVRNLPLDRNYSYTPASGIYADILNDDQNYQTYLIGDSQINSGRAIVLPEAVIGVDNIIEAPEPDAIIRWNDTGTKLIGDAQLGIDLDKAGEYAALSREWATNPNFQPIDDGINPLDYSSKHYADRSQYFNENSYQWAQEGYNVPVFDGVNPTGYSSYHWALNSKLNSEGLMLEGTFDPNTDTFTPPQPTTLEDGMFWIVTSSDLTPPSLGLSLIEGDYLVYFSANTPEPYIKVANTVHWDNIVGTPQTISTEIEVTSSGQVHYAINYQPDTLLVFQNGIALSPSDYVDDVANPISGIIQGFTLNTAPLNGDIIHATGILAYVPATVSLEQYWETEALRLTAESYAVEPEDVLVKEYTSNKDGTFTPIDTTDYSSLHWERKATTAGEDIVTEGDTQVARVIAEGDTQDARVIAEGDTQDARIVALGDGYETSITTMGDQYLVDITAEGDTQVARVIVEGDKSETEAWEAEAEKKTSNSWGSEPEDVPVKLWVSNGDGTFTSTDTNPAQYSSYHWQEKAKVIAAGLTYMGTWDASTGVYPPDGTTDGEFYIIEVAGNISGVDWRIGDWMMWEVAAGAYTRIGWQFDWSAIQSVTIDGALPISGDDLARRSTTYTKTESDTANTTQDTEIALKANITDVDTDNAAQDAQIALKANITDVDAANAAQDTVINGKEPANANIQAHVIDVTTNPHATTATQVGAPGGSWTFDGTVLTITIP